MGAERRKIKMGMRNAGRMLSTSTGGRRWAGGTNHSVSISEGAHEMGDLTAVSMSQFAFWARGGAG
jgi:hypothetical protein